MRSTWSLPIFAIAVTFAFLVALAFPPTDDSSALTRQTPALQNQNYIVVDGVPPGVARDAFAVSRIPTARTAPAAGVPDPGTAKAIAYDMVLARGWDQAQYECLVALWDRESGWNVYAHNRSSGAYGIPQALPGNKMASAGADWETNPATQITWGLGYIAGRYGTPCGAWEHSELKGWY